MNVLDFRDLIKSNITNITLTLLSYVPLTLTLLVDWKLNLSAYYTVHWQVILSFNLAETWWMSGLLSGLETVQVREAHYAGRGKSSGNWWRFKLSLSADSGEKGENNR